MTEAITGMKPAGSLSYHEHTSKQDRLAALDAKVETKREAFRDSTGDEGIRRAARELADAKTARNTARRDYP